MTWTPLAASLALGLSALAEPLPARDTADVGRAGQYSVGVFAPLTVAVRDRLELQAYPLLFFISPNAVLRLGYGELLGFRLAEELALSCPTPAMRLLQGTLFPSFTQGGGRVGWVAVPRIGLVASRGDRASRVLTLSADVALGLTLSRNDATAPSGVTPLVELFAPVYAGFRARLGATYDVRLLDWLRARAFLGVSLHGVNADYPSPVAFNAGAGFDVAVGKHSRFAVGFLWWNADTHAIDPKSFARLRSNDVYPTIDFIWAG